MTAFDTRLTALEARATARTPFDDQDHHSGRGFGGKKGNDGSNNQGGHRKRAKKNGSQNGGNQQPAAQ